MKTNTFFSRLRILASSLFAVTILTGLALETDANAQRRPQMDKATYLNQVIPELVEQVGLDDDQAEQVRAILGEQFDEQQAVRQAMRSGNGGSREGMREKMQALNKSTDEKINALLTDDQKGAYAKFREEQDAQRLNNRGGRPGQQGQL